MKRLATYFACPLVLTSPTPANLATEASILRRFRTAAVSLHGDTGGWRPGSPLPHCDWYGVLCDADGSVIAM